MASIRLAHHYVLTVAAQRHPTLLGCHRWRDELFLVISAVLERHSLVRNGASFAESFYNLRRQGDAGGGGETAAPTWRSAGALALLLIPAYLRTKVEDHLEGNAAPAGSDDDAAAAARPGGVRAVPRGASTEDLNRSPAGDMGRRVAQLLCRAFCTALNAHSLIRLLLFMHGRCRHANLGQALLGYTLQRQTQGISSAVATSARTARPTQQAGPSSHRLHRLFALAEAPLRHARHLLLLSVFGYQLLEWWHAAEHVPPSPLRWIPPPPPPPATSEDARCAPNDTCGLCRMPMQEPTVALSGFVYCAVCADETLRRTGRCPLSGMRIRDNDLHRIYETSRAASSR